MTPTTRQKCNADDCPFPPDAELDIHRGWHLERRVGLDVIISTIMLLAAAVGYAMHIDSRQTTAEVEIKSLKEMDARAVADVRTQKDDLNKKVDRIEEKLDRLLMGRR